MYYMPGLEKIQGNIINEKEKCPKALRGNGERATYYLSFRGVYIDYGVTVWNDGDIDIAPEYLYENSVPAEQTA